MSIMYTALLIDVLSPVVQIMTNALSVVVTKYQRPQDQRPRTLSNATDWAFHTERLLICGAHLLSKETTFTAWHIRHTTRTPFNMTASSISTSSDHSSRSYKCMKRVQSVPQALQINVSEGVVLSSKDNFLQSSTPGKRRYMRRGSRCPSMLRVTMSLPKDLASLHPEFDSLAQQQPPGRPIFSFLDSLSSTTGSEATRNLAAVDLVTEALQLSSNFDDLDIDTK